jgi:hypothetical protein
MKSIINLILFCLGFFLIITGLNNTDILGGTVIQVYVGITCLIISSKMPKGAIIIALMRLNLLLLLFFFIPGDNYVNNFEPIKFYGSIISILGAVMPDQYWAFFLSKIFSKRQNNQSPFSSIVKTELKASTLIAVAFVRVLLLSSGIAFTLIGLKHFHQNYFWGIVIYCGILALLSAFLPDKTLATTQKK